MQKDLNTSMFNENIEKSLKEQYLEKIDSLSTSIFNEDQKELCKTIIENAKEDDVQNIYQLLIQRIKIGFAFDVAPTPTTTNKFITLLKENKELSFGTEKLELNSSKEKDILIIGENFDVLNNLRAIERERERERAGLEFNYDVIYLDPPYNTEATQKDGNNLANDKDDMSASKFIYRDKFSRNGWLNMIRERFVKSRTILKEDGVIFVSIDDAEQAYLKVLMDEIFGEENFVTIFLWQTNNSAMKRFKYVRNDLEYILCYAKNKEKLKEFSKKENEIITFENIDNDPKGPWISTNATYKLNENNENTFDLQLPNGNTIRRTWRFSKEEFLKGEVPLFFSGNNVPRIKVYENEYDKNKVFSNLAMSFEKPSINDFEKSSSFIDYFNYVDSFSKARKQLEQILNNDTFSTPKPTSLIKFLIKLVNNKNARVLDFFAGSGTTAHAVWDLNREDGGNRSVTLVTNNENGIGKNVTYERLHRISLGKSTDGNVNFKWLDKNEPYQVPLKVYETKQFSIDINNNLEEKTELFIKEMQELANVNLDEKDDNERILYYLKQLYSLKNDEDQNETN
ncbi:site-specific DNA-methyltransferase [Mycoplasmopsis gallinacea]|uniref:C-terminal truncated Type III restriction-modification system: methylase n=1 Tax=Mycoplasmopsis gallinacea TaxID=29556 RepID=A0A449A248_9BACT|nr:site-specific DNA-methyltransferase [Mycoplasmopsis gallinacea]VEU58325.1 C-terminal truncated Type III restriction-modification system: methylase [Mycoplasmopsis gallinacea]